MDYNFCLNDDDENVNDYVYIAQYVDVLIIIIKELEFKFMFVLVLDSKIKDDSIMAYPFEHSWMES